MLYRGRPSPFFTGGPLLSTVRWHWGRASTGRHATASGGGSLSGRKITLENLWREFFSDPSQWWDNRSEKVNSRYPDFKHKKTNQSLWLDSNLVPAWVEAELAALPPGTLQLDIFSWNLRLQRYVKAREYRKALELFQQLQREGMVANQSTFVPVLNACARLGIPEEGRRIHALIVQSGQESDVYVASCLVDMYAKCGCIEEARKVFNKMPSRNVVSWNAMILGYVKCGEAQKALGLSEQMYREGVEPSSVTFVGVLNACANLGALEEGRHIHGQITQRGYESNIFIGNSLVNMYTKCGSIEEAQRVFNMMPLRDLVSWTAMILGYVKCGRGQKALDIFLQMYAEGVEPSPVTFLAVLSACASLGALEEGRLVHEQVTWRGYESDMFMASNLVDMYAKCGSIEDAHRVFNKMPSRDVVSWNAIILGYVRCGEGQKALELSRQMYSEGVEPNPVTFVGLVNACATIAALEEGKLVHDEISRRGYESDVFVASSLIDMYAKCGSIEDAQRVFNKMPVRDGVSWNAMLAGYARHGWAKEALVHFGRMCQEDVEVNGATLGSLLLACSHGGLPEEGLYFFESLSKIYNISPTKEQYVCIVDLLGRAGYLHHAHDLIRSMPCEADPSVWVSLLGACRIHGNVELGEHVAKQVSEMEPENAWKFMQFRELIEADVGCRASA